MARGKGIQWFPIHSHIGWTGGPPWGRVMFIYIAVYMPGRGGYDDWLPGWADLDGVILWNSIPHRRVSQSVECRLSSVVVESRADRQTDRQRYCHPFPPIT